MECSLEKPATEATQPAVDVVMAMDLVLLAVGIFLSLPSSTFITKTRIFKYLKKITSKNRKFSDKKTLTFFHISAQNIDCGYS